MRCNRSSNRLIHQKKTAYARLYIKLVHKSNINMLAKNMLKNMSLLFRSIIDNRYYVHVDPL